MTTASLEPTLATSALAGAELHKTHTGIVILLGSLAYELENRSTWACWTSAPRKHERWPAHGSSS